MTIYSVGKITRPDGIEVRAQSICQDGDDKDEALQKLREMMHEVFRTRGFALLPEIQGE